MKKNTIIYPGSFDPMTNGHLDLISRTSGLFDQVIVGITQNQKKPSFLPVETRLMLVKEVVKHLHHVKVLVFDTLLVEFAQRENARMILRGLRAVSDFEYEFQLSGMNKHLDADIETLFMTSAEKYANISSSLVREIVLLGGDISKFVPTVVKESILEYVKKL